MQFTPQQLAGAQRYGNKTRIGNWFEDLCIEESKRNEFKHQRNASLAFEQKTNVFNKFVSLT